MDRVFTGTGATADVLIQLAQKDPNTASKYPQKDYRSWLIGRFPGGTSAFTAAVQKGVVAGSVAARTSTAAPAGTAAPQPPATSARPLVPAREPPFVAGD